MIEHQTFVKILNYYAAIMPRYAPDFSNPAVFHFWHQEFGSLNMEKFKAAMDSLMRTMAYFPQIKDVNEALGSLNLSDDDLAREISARIVSAIRLHGGYNHEDSRKYIGELGWDVVNMSGGWGYLCDTITNNNLTTYSAQLRNLAVTLVKKNRAGESGPPALPEAHIPNQNSELPLAKALRIASKGA